MLIRLGYELEYQCAQATPMILNLNVHYSRTSDLVRPDIIITDPSVPMSMYRDSFGNWCTRTVAPPGRFRISSDALIRDSGVDLSPVITHRLPLAQFDEAMRLLENGEAGKILLTVKHSE